MNKIYWIGLLSAGLAVSCQSTSTTDIHVKEQKQEQKEEHEVGITVFEPEKAKAIGLKTIKIKSGTFSEVIKTSGRILAAQGSESTIVATVPGIVSFGKVQFAEGMAVRKGTPLLTLASDQLAEGNIAAKTKAVYEKARETYERVKGLIDSQIVSQQEFEQAQLEYENAKTAWEAIADKQTGNGVAVVASMNGYLKSLQVKEGDYVTTGQPLATISQYQRLRLRAEVSEKYYSHLPSVRTAHFKTPYNDKVYHLDELNGRLISTAKSAEDNSFYLPITFEFENRGEIIPGSFVEIYLLGTPKEDVISIPIEALIEEQGIFSVYLQLDEDCYKKVTVTCGMDNGTDIQILNGLQEGDNVVIHGAYQLKLASASNAIPAHTHQH